MIKRQMPIVVIALLLLIIETTCSANAQMESKYTMMFHNKSDKTMEYTLYKLDRIHVKFNHEIVRSVRGKLEPGKSDVVTMPVGAYYIAWFDAGEAVLIDGTRFTHFAATTFVFK